MFKQNTYSQPTPPPFPWLGSLTQLDPTFVVLLLGELVDKDLATSLHPSCEGQSPPGAAPGKGVRRQTWRWGWMFQGRRTGGGLKHLSQMMPFMVIYHTLVDFFWRPQKQQFQAILCLSVEAFKCSLKPFNTLNNQCPLWNHSTYPIYQSSIWTYMNHIESLICAGRAADHNINLDATLNK